MRDRTELAEVLAYVRSSPEVAAALFQDDFGAQLPDQQHELRLAIVGRLFIGHYLDIRPDAAWSDEVFDSAFAHLADCIGEGGRVSVVSLLPLKNLTCECDCIELAPDLVIRRLPLDEKQALYRRYDRLTGVGVTPMGVADARVLAGVSHAIEQRYDYPPAGPVPVDRPFEALAVLRIFKPGGVGGWRWFNHPTRPAFYENLEKQYLPPSPFLDPLVLRGSYELGEDDVDELVALHTAYSSTAADAAALRRLKFVINRFTLGYERRGFADQLVDTWIALESLFAEDDKTELSHRASLRIARLLEEDLERRKELYRTLKHSYGRRSKIIHGSAEPSDTRAVAVATEDVLRRCLRRILETGSELDLQAIDFS